MLMNCLLSFGSGCVIYFQSNEIPNLKYVSCTDVRDILIMCWGSKPDSPTFCFFPSYILSFFSFSVILSFLCYFLSLFLYSSPCISLLNLCVSSLQSFLLSCCHFIFLCFFPFSCLSFILSVSLSHYWVNCVNGYIHWMCYVSLDFFLLVGLPQSLYLHRTVQDFSGTLSKFRLRCQFQAVCTSDCVATGICSVNMPQSLCAAFGCRG
jgi:hypothetical protein